MDSLHRLLPWQVFTACGAALVLLCLFLPDGLVRAVLVAGVSVAAAVATAVGARLHRPQRASAWWLLAAGLMAWALGDVSYTVCYTWLGWDTYPSVPDVFYVLAYPLIAAALLRMARQARPGADREGVIDAAVLAVGFGLLSWTFLVRPALASLPEDLFAGLVALAYPVGDVVVLAMLVRVFAAAGHGSRAFGLLAGAAVFMLLADALWQYADAYAGLDDSWIDPVFMTSYVLWGAAALHPSMRRLSDPSPSSRHEFSPLRLAVLTAASLLSPGTLGLQLALGQQPQGWAVVISSAVLFLLVVARMSALLGRLREQTALLGDLARTDPLTGLLNRRSADAALERVRERTRREGTPLVVALLDLDRFKDFNDTRGHPAGDRLLVGAASAWGAVLAGTGIQLARWGGEEFLLVASGWETGRVEQLLDDLRAVVPEGQTFSAGLARWDGQEATDRLVARADEALYAAKHAGRACSRTAALRREGEREGEQLHPAG
ncbi:diguanylate cyclase (GGDEF)-like protein [Kineococcus radiotolerans]|uniref:Diguanylate cyclase (GGDEF)-like protein n=1 Tax=Kineococcus radiotolerans TaxID=131568 RepID=A0A7W4XY19_KINRA|nr:GGDEF domain-containing protein [Kineococcus radiotolerans]MBB2901815.1 diguanylate cyclase (GGDEF)-like protein [Kineococcus radiotolerans]